MDFDIEMEDAVEAYAVEETAYDILPVDDAQVRGFRPYLVFYAVVARAPN